MPAARAQSKKTPPKKPADFDVVFARLRSILVPYAQRLEVKEDTSAYYYLETKTATYKGKPGFFAAVRKGKNYVSFHLMALYVFPEMLKSVSPALLQRMQGKSCFNFTQIDEELFAELERLTAASARGFAGKTARFT
jgi:hypothetical protein